MNREKPYQTAARMKKYYSLQPGASISRQPDVRKAAFINRFNKAAKTIQRTFAAKQLMNSARSAAKKRANARKVISAAVMHYLYKPGGSRVGSIKKHFNKSRA